MAKDGFEYPFGREIWENGNIWYHGTSSAYTNKIESDGWNPGDLPYSKSDIEPIVEVYDNIKMATNEDNPILTNCAGTYYQFRDLDSENITVRNTVSFAWNYWYARNYSMNKGGEALSELLSCIDSLSKNWDERNLHSSQINAILEKQLPVLNRIRKRLESVLELSFPVVYAVELEGISSNHKGVDPYGDFWGFTIEKKIDVFISQEKIVGKAFFPDGILTPYYPGFGD